MATANEKNVWAFLKSKGMSDAGAASVMGNLEQEDSTFNPGVKNSIGAFGIAQWLGSRKTSLQNFAASRGEAADSLDAQLNYLWKELSSGNYGSLEQLNNLSPQEGAIYFMNKFEKPGNDGSGGNRITNSLQIYQSFTGQKLSYTPDASSSGGGSSSSGGNQSYSTNSDLASQIDQSLKIGTFSLTNPFKYGAAVSMRAGIAVIGLLLVAFGLYAVVKHA